MNINKETFTSEDAYVARDNEIKKSTKEYLDNCVDYILMHKGTKHPFLLSYADKGLSNDKSKILYLETLGYFSYLPFYVAGIAQLTRDEAVLRSIGFNVMDELGKKTSHTEMYYNFLVKKGITEKEIKEYRCSPSTKALNNGIRSLYNTLPLETALGALFADETMSAYMVEQYNNGLIKEGVSKKDRFFWELHMKVEVGHSNAVFNVMSPYLDSNNGKEKFDEGIEQYMYLMNQYWNGIEKLIEGLSND